MVCTGAGCPRRNWCGRFYMNVCDQKRHTVENLYSFGSATCSDKGCSIHYICGEAGNWSMYKPMSFGLHSSSVYIDEDFS